MSEFDATDTGLVVLILADSGNKEVLSAWLAEHGITAETVEPGDPLPENTSLCLADIGALASAAPEIRRQKDDKGFLPCLLVVPQRLGPQVAASDDSRFDFVDELVTVPIDPKTLGHRIDNLLTQYEAGDDPVDRLSLSSVVESLPFPAFVVVDGGVTNSNSALHRALGVEQDDLHGRSLAELLAADDAETVANLFEETSVSVEHVRLVGRDESLPVELRPITIEDGVVSGYLGISRTGT